MRVATAKATVIVEGEYKPAKGKEGGKAGGKASPSSNATNTANDNANNNDNSNNSKSAIEVLKSKYSLTTLTAENEENGRTYLRKHDFCQGLQDGIHQSCLRLAVRFFIVDDSG